MAAVKYQVLIMRSEVGNVASIPDLKCQAVGLSVADAITTVHRKALGILQEFEGATFGPPTPSRLTLVSIELPAPSIRRESKHLRLVAGLGHSHEWRESDGSRPE